MEVKKIVEGMTAPQVAQVIDENFNALNGEKATVEAVADVQKNVNRSDDNTGVLSYPEYSSTEPVAVGDVRRYEGLLYRAKEEGAYDWDPEKWERVTLKQLEDEKLSELGSEVGIFLDADTGNTSKVLARDFKQGEKIYITYYGSSYIKFVQYRDSQNVEHTSERVDVYNGEIKEFVFPTDAKKVYFYFGNSKSDNKGGLATNNLLLDVAKRYTDSNISEVSKEVDSAKSKVVGHILKFKSGSTSENLVKDFSEGEKIYITYYGSSYIKFIQYHNVEGAEITSERIDLKEGGIYEFVFPENAKDIFFYFGNTDEGNKAAVLFDSLVFEVSKMYADNIKKNIDKKLDEANDSYYVLKVKGGNTSESIVKNFSQGDKIYFSYKGNSFIKFIQYRDSEGVERTSPRVDIYEGTLYEYVFPEDATSVNAYFGTSDANSEAIVSLTSIQATIFEIEKRLSALENTDEAVTLKTFSPQMDCLESNCYLGSRTYGGSIGKCLQLAHISDTHGDYKALENAVVLSEYPTIDAVVHTGDYLVNAFTTDLGKKEYKDIVSNATKPILFSLGNHDVGDGNGVSFCGTHKQVYDTFIAPLQAKGFITANGNNYYYKDFTNAKVRVIVLYEQDMPLDYDDSVWQHIEYNSEYPLGVNGQSYNAGDIINIQGHTGASFRAVVNTTLSMGYDYNKTTEPSYKINRGFRVLSKQQMEWFCNVLATTPSGYGIVVALHNFFSEDISLVDCKFTGKFANVNVSHNCMKTDIIAEIVNAFVNRDVLNINVATKPESAYGVGNNKAAYLNVFTDGNGDKYWYNLQATFTNVDASVKFLSFIGGHTHFDAVVRHNKYKDLIQVTETCTVNVNQKNMGSSDIKTSTDSLLLAYNCINVEGFDQTDMAVRLTKVGARYTVDGKLRDFEKIEV